MATETADRRPARLTDRLRQAIRDSRLSYHALARLAGVGQPLISRFMTGERDITLVAAACICQVLGLDLAQAAPVLTEPLDDPELSTRKRRKEGAPPPPFTEDRGQGKRVDLLAEREEVPAAAAAPAGDASDGDGEARPKKRRCRAAAAPASPAVPVVAAEPAAKGGGSAKPATPKSRRRKKTTE